MKQTYITQLIDKDHDNWLMVETTPELLRTIAHKVYISLQHDLQIEKERHPSRERRIHSH